ncbi:MAG TPA: GNAT family N-acetyltransferase [Acidimicrobiales bacterium]|nr:GNAT family N-acetyltransferase [Acidimicrobiales bacterium]
MTELPDGLQLRAAVDGDWWAVVALVSACWAEYPGCVMDAHGECPDLLAPATVYGGAGGDFWVVVDRCQTVVAVAGWKPLDSGAVEMERLYVDPRWRRHGVASALAGMVESVASERDAPAVELWSDTRFKAAHSFYERRGYVNAGPDRRLGDLSRTVEHHFVLSRDAGDS